MKYWVVISIGIIAVLSSGCTIKRNAGAVSPAHYQAHSVLYEVQYDTECIAQVEIQKRIFTLRQGQRLLPKNFSNLKTDGRYLRPGITLPENTIGLYMSVVANDFYYILIDEKGNFISDYHLLDAFRAHGGDHVDFLAGNSKDGEGCKTIGSKPLFKAIRR